MQFLKITTTPLEYKIKVEEASLTKLKEESIPQSKSDILSRKVSDKKVILKDKVDISNAQVKKDDPKAAENKQTKTYSSGITSAAVTEYTKASNILQKDKELHSEKLSGDKEKKLLDNQIEELEFEYKAGSFKIEIVKKPEVDIEYIAGFNYAPPSSDPDYDESE